MRKSSRLPLEALTPWLIDEPRPPAPAGAEGVAAAPPPLVWREVFGNDNSVEIEVGFGKGLFLLVAASACPTVNFLGVEIVRKYQLFTATRLARGRVPNVRLACADARLFLRDRVPVASVGAVHVYFPDPWWKKRHHKRRVFTATFADCCTRVLRPGGRLHVVTDVAEYFQVIRATLAARTGLREVPPPAPPAGTHEEDYLTNFERKYRKEGRPIHRAAYERIRD